MLNYTILLVTKNMLFCKRYNDFIAIGMDISRDPNFAEELIQYQNYKVLIEKFKTETFGGKFAEIHFMSALSNLYKKSEPLYVSNEVHQYIYLNFINHNFSYSDVEQIISQD